MLLGMKWAFENLDLQMIDFKLTKWVIFNHQVVENLNYSIKRLNG